MRPVISLIKNDDVSFNHTVNENADPDIFSAHLHDRCEIIYLVRGDMIYTTEGKSYELKNGDIIISKPYIIHNIYPSKETVYERYDIIIDHKKLSDELWQKIKSGRDVYKCAGNDLIYETFAKMDYYYGKFGEEDYTRLINNAAEEILYNLSLMEGEEGVSVNPIIDRALDYIRKNLTSIGSVDEICDALYITKGHLHHLFIEHIKMTPMKYVTSKRLMLARRKIRRGARPTEVFTECGFNDYATFFRNYKSYFGYSPSEECEKSALLDILS
jgi:AraC-like DNA-binding protein/mannose-6-phosphate isomerase-like protein (cupin superfamily)